MSANIPSSTNLRDALARLVNRNIELRQRLDDLQVETTGVGIDALAAALARMMVSAERAMAAEALEGRRYTIPDLEMSLQGFLEKRGEALVFCLPRPEQNLMPELLSTVQLRVAHVPPASDSAAPSAPKEILESAQAAFSGWGEKAGGAAARDITGQLTRLLAALEDGNEEEVVRAAGALAGSAARFGAALARKVPPEVIQKYRASVAELRQVAASLAKTRRGGPEELIILAQAVKQITEDYHSIRASITYPARREDFYHS